MLAHLRQKNAPKNQFGIPISEATDEEGAPSNPKGFMWEATGPTVDYAAAAVAKAKKAYYERWKDRPSDGDLWSVKRVDLS
jgi:hypothetical protein